MLSFSTLRSKLRAIPIRGLSNLSSLLAHPNPTTLKLREPSLNPSLRSSSNRRRLLGLEMAPCSGEGGGGGADGSERDPPNLYSRHFLKSAAERFGQDHQEIAKWLSGSDLKKVALFGCPSVERKTVFAAKRLRSFFSIQEDTTCHACKLKKSCKFVHQKVARQEKLILPDVMRVLTLFALDAIPRQLFVPHELKLSVDKLLKEVINLSS
uniref:Uncharacterized protein n=1 Tax=Ananas comosus var. bracteatus TaxID=296719 RepID=A0A6V7QJB1_ANACO|nr:unnamed protein product [Ananas comosus var. bracteatus]